MIRWESGSKRQWYCYRSRLAGLEGGADKGRRSWTVSGREIEAWDARQKEWAAKVLADVKEAAGCLGIAAETVHVPDAQPAEAIIATANKGPCDPVVMASHGRRGLRRLLLGSQTSEVLVGGPVPVLVVK